MVELPHAVHQVVHAGEVGAHADLVLLHGLVAAHHVEAGRTLALLQDVLKGRLEQAVAHFVSKVGWSALKWEDQPVTMISREELERYLVLVVAVPLLRVEPCHRVARGGHQGRRHCNLVLRSRSFGGQALTSI